MARTRRLWTAADVAKLKELAGWHPVEEIARALDRTEGAVVMEASKLKISLGTKRRIGRPSETSAPPGADT